MKKTFLSFTMMSVLILCGYGVTAQGLMVDFNVGYGMPSGGERMTSEYTSTTTGTSGTSTDKTKVRSFGSGLNLGVAGLYSFNENVGAGLGINYLLGSPVKMTSTDNDDGDISTYEWSLKARFLRLNPHIFISAGNKTISPYARFGVVMGFGSLISTEDNSETSGGATTKMNTETKFSGGMALGWNGAFGVSYGLSDNMSFFGELNLISMSYSPSKSEVTAATVDGQDVLKDMTTRDKETEYSDEITYTWGGTPTPPNEGEPRKDLKFSVPMSSFGVNVGIRIRL